MSKLGKFAAACAAVLSFGCFGAELPAGCEEYREVEYLNSHGRYVDLGVSPSGDTNWGVEIKFSVADQTVSGEAWVMGFWMCPSWRVGANGGTWSATGFTRTETYDDWWTAVATSAPGTGKYNFILFGQQESGTVRYTGGSFNFRFAYCTITHNGETVRDYVPCVRISDNTVGLFDKANATYTNGSGSNPFTWGGKLCRNDWVVIGEAAVGNECQLPAPASIMADDGVTELWYPSGWTFVGKSGATVSGKGKKQAAVLTPTEPGVLTWKFKSDTEFVGTCEQYQEHEYIQSRGAQYVDTKYIPQKGKTTVQLTYKYATIGGGENRVYGQYGAGCFWRVGVGSNGADAADGFTVTTDADGWKTAIGTAPGTATISDGLFAQHESTGFKHYSSHVAVSMCKIWEDGVLRRDYTPCKRLGDDMPGFYDEVNNEFYMDKNGSKGFDFGPLVLNSWAEIRGYEEGDVFPMTIPAAGTNDTEDTRWQVVGWTFEGVDGSRSSGVVTDDFRFPYAVDGTLRWQYKIEYKVTASAGEGGSVEPAELWVENGRRGTFVATPDEGKFFGGWTGDVPSGETALGTLALVVDGPKTIAASFSESSGTFVWTGAGEDALASNDANWKGGAKPTAMAAVVFGADGKGTNCTWDLDIPLVSWTQTEDYGGTVTIRTTFAETGFPVLRILGDCSILSGGWTHPSDCAGTQTYRLKASIGGNLTIGPDAKLDAYGLGFSKNGNNRYPTGLASTTTGCHGGIGGSVDAATGLTHLYDSITEPVNVGSGGSGGATWSGSPGGGGGAIYLTVGGKLTHNGKIDADGNDGAGDANYLGSGGSVYVRAGSIEGVGTMTACAQSGSNSGAGGRIAVVLTDEEATFDGYDIVRLASAYSKQSANSEVGKVGGCGTIYAETPANRKDHGWVIFKNNGRALDPHRGGILCYGTNFEADYDKITCTNAAMIYVASGHTINLQHTTLDFDASNPNVKNGFHFAGGRVILPEDAENFTFDYAVTLASTTIPVSGVSAWEVMDKGSLRVTVSPTLDCSLVNDEGGKIATEGTAALTLLRDFTNNGTFEQAEKSVLIFAGDEPSTISGSTTFAGFQCQTPGKKLVFKAGDTFTFDYGLTLNGSDTQPIVLASTTKGSAYGFDVDAGAATFLQYLTVADSDASEGAKLTAYMSAGENCTNWEFDNSGPLNAWFGTSSSDFADPSNWSLGRAPADGENLIVNSVNPMVISTPFKPKNIELKAGANVTINAQVDASGDVEIAAGAVLTWNRPGTIGGNLSVRANGQLAHDKNSGKVQTNWIELTIGGNVEIEANGQINAHGRGCTDYNYPLNSTQGDRVCHGGLGIDSSGWCYGSPFCPTTFGSTSRQGNSSSIGGGRIQLTVAGTVNCDGTINASGIPRNPKDGNYNSAGGSVWLTAGKLTGAGKVMANGGYVEYGTGGQGGGGRIALYLTGAESAVADFTGTIEAKGSDANSGTIYTQIAADKDYCGTILVDGFNRGTSGYAQYPAATVTSKDVFDEAEIKAARHVNLSIVRKGAVKLTRDVAIGGLSIATNGKLDLAGHTLKIYGKKPKGWTDAGITYGGTAENPGKIVWCPPGLKLIVR